MPISQRRQQFVQQVTRTRDRYAAVQDRRGQSTMSRILEEVAVSAITHEMLDLFEGKYNQAIGFSQPPIQPGGGQFGGAGATGSWDDNDRPNTSGPSKNLNQATMGLGIAAASSMSPSPSYSAPSHSDNS